MPSKKVRIAVVGAGYFGSLHATKFPAVKGAQLVAICDTQLERAEATAAPSGAQAFTDHRRLEGVADAAVVAVPTVAHYEVAKDLLEAGIDVLIEKPMCETLDEADALIRLAKRKKRILQAGHLERFSPVIDAMVGQVTKPWYIESQRVSPFRGRGADTTVILDMMIHDLDHALRIAGAPLVDIEAVGSPVLTELEDLASARLRFANGCVASLTASRVGGKISRRLRVYQRDRYVIADMGENKLTVLHPTKGGNGVLPSLVGDDKQFPTTDLLLLQAKDFVDSVRSRGKPRVPAEEVRPVLAAALEITDKLRAWRKAWR
ncbi:MAG: Gfo/Idh/MocA family oxidoreductase [Rhodospirillaceae bacterium]|nr:Gfo/Idh/MocA family oxidoreductase [Rhodospirillaceae bacterium]